MMQSAVAAGTLEDMSARTVLAAASVVLLVAPPSVAAGGEPSRTRCRHEYDVDFSPGVSTRPTSGTVTSNGGTGVMSCSGPVNGLRPTGPGRFGFRGFYGTRDPDTCQTDGEGRGVASFTVPTEGGDQHITDPLTFVYGVLDGNGLVGGTWQGERAAGIFEVMPTKGDCVTAPITASHARATWTLSE